MHMITYISLPYLILVIAAPFHVRLSSDGGLLKLTFFLGPSYIIIYHRQSDLYALYHVFVYRSAFTGASTSRSRGRSRCTQEDTHVSVHEKLPPRSPVLSPVLVPRCPEPPRLTGKVTLSVRVPNQRRDGELPYCLS
ncbi:hypothetical protein BD414DRAFT_59702 [Trametes punicea]|nr:hypothetical protein BD414DRAFT_59702 [Trametes punicea]